MVRIEIVQVVTDAKNAPRTVHVAGERPLDRSILQSAGEYLAGGITHPRELLQTFWPRLRHVGRLCWKIIENSKIALPMPASERG
jgi:hypothetical protein